MGNLMTSRDPKRDPDYDWNRPYVREIEFKDFHDSAMAALSAEARFNWMKAARGTLGSLAERKNAGLRHFNEMIASVIIHLIAQVFQFILIIYFVVSMVSPMQVAYNPAHLQNNTYMLDQAIEAHNPFMVPLYLQAQCRMNLSFTWLHRVMMIVMVIKMMPELANVGWLLYRVWVIPNEGNHDIDPIDEKEDSETFQFKDKKKLQKKIATHKAEWTAKVESHYEWRDEDTVKKEWKQQVLLLDKIGHMVKISRVEQLKEEDFPIMWVTQEVEEVHNIGRFSSPWKIFATCFILVPVLVMNCYMMGVGAMMIAYCGAPSKLIKLALKIKFLIKIPEAIFEGYASRDLKTFLEGSCFTITEDCQPTKPDAWATWLAPIVKLIFACCAGYTIYEWFFHDVIAFRVKCSQFFDEFEGVIAIPPELMSFW